MFSTSLQPLFFGYFWKHPKKDSRQTFRYFLTQKLKRPSQLIALGDRVRHQGDAMVEHSSWGLVGTSGDWWSGTVSVDVSDRERKKKAEPLNNES